MAAPASFSKICFNPLCGASVSEQWRKGWRLRSGDVAELCDRCGSAYDELRFCEDFHSDAAGWRNCETCGKRLHCGCIASVHAFLLLDAGGVECISCTKTSVLNAASNQLKPSSWFSSLPILDGLTDQSTKTWSQVKVTNSGLGQRPQSPSLWHSLAWHTDSYSRMKYSSTKKAGDKLLHLEQSSTCLVESKSALEKEAGGIFKFLPQNRTDNGNSEVNEIRGLLDADHDKGGKNHETGRKMTINDLEVKKYVNCQKYEPLGSCQNITSSRDDTSIASGLSVPLSLQNDTRNSSKPSGSHAQQQRSSKLFPKEYSPSLHVGQDSSKETENKMMMARPRSDGRSRNQSILSRYWPRITDQELQKISGDSNSVVTPLFEKTLSASDAGRIGRLVLPKKCAETYFPAISHPEGLPLKIQDVNGKEWIFQFRFWPNNNSRMYVLEGVTSCIQSMQLQAGDIVTFSRIDPEEKLLMGFRKASSSLSDQDVQSLENHAGGEVSSRIEGCNEVVTALSAYSSKGTVESIYDSSGKQIGPVDVAYSMSVNKTAGKPKNASGLSLGKRRNRAFGSKSRQPCVFSKDSIKMKLTWEEAQELLQPPHNHIPSIVIIEGHEFEEYEEPPILGKRTVVTTDQMREKTQWVQCKDCSKWRKLPVDAHLPPRWVCSDNVWDPERSSCSSAQEVSSKQLEGLPSQFAHKESRVPKKLKSGEHLTKLDELADLAILDENESHHPPTHAPTTRHPRHRPGCSCIVCIQPPSGQGPKHEPTCTCNVCLTVKRRFRTLMLRRKKRQSEKEAENAQRNLQNSPEKTEAKFTTCIQEVVEPEMSDDDPSKKSLDVSRNAADNGGSPSCSAYKEKAGGIGKATIDLNSQPEREDDFSPRSDADDVLKPLHDLMWMGIACSSKDHVKQISSNTVDLVDDKSREVNGDPHEHSLQEVGSPGATHLSKPVPAPATTAA